MKKTLAIIAEYNPFHLGHLYQIQKARERFPDHDLLIIMSPNFTQRGLPAVTDKSQRTLLVLKAGADMVISHPVVSATSSAREFARGAIGILEASGIVTDLLFGAECDDIALLEETANILYTEPDKYKEILLEDLSQGKSYPLARQSALFHIAGKSVSDILLYPNNILAIEYINAIRFLGSDIKPHPLKRIKEYTSSTQIRDMIKNNISIESFVPDITFFDVKNALNDNLCMDINDFSLILHKALLDINDYSDFLDGSIDISNRIEKYIEQFTSISDFGQLIKTKNITYSHIMRHICHIFLGIENSHMDTLKSLSYAPYIKILGMKKNCDLISRINDFSKIPVLSSIKDMNNLDANAMKILDRDIYSDRIYRMVQTSKSQKPLPDITREKFMVI